MRRLKIIVSIIVIVMVIVFLFFIFGIGRRPVVGVLLPIDSSGSYADTRAGILTAIKELPRDVKFIDIDYTSSDVATVISDALRDGVRYFVGSNTSSDIESIKGIMNGSKAILIDSQLTNPGVINSVKNLYTVSSMDSIQADAIASYIKFKQYRSITILKGIENQVYVDYLSSQTQKDLELEGINSSLLKTSEINSIDSTPDCVVLVMSSNEAMAAMKEIRSKFGELPFIGSDWTLNQNLFDDLDVSKGMVTVGFTNINDTSLSFIDKIESLNVQIDSPSILAYNAVEVIYILAKNGITADDAKNYLDKNIFFGANSSFSFKDKYVNSPIYFYEVEPMNYQLVWKFGG